MVLICNRIYAEPGTFFHRINLIASRILKFKSIDSEVLGELIVETYKSYLLKDLPISPGYTGCTLKVRGIDTDYYDQEVYGAGTM